MNVDCQWIEKNLEPLFCGTLSPEDQVRARRHIEDCGACAKEVAALNSIDPLVKTHFQAELQRALRRPAFGPRRFAKGRLAFNAAAVLAFSLLVVAILRTPQNTANRSASSREEAAASEPSPPAPPVKPTDTTTVERAKPAESAPDNSAQTSRIVATPAPSAPDFLVVDPAGYSRTLNDYRGYFLVIGILNSGQPEATANLERIYKTFNSNPKFRFIGVSNDRQAKPAKTTFPMAYNHGSKLFGALPGEFVLLDEMGSILLRGSLAKDLDRLQTALQAK